MANRAAEYSIAAVSKLTGVGCHALRVWERRYGFPVPRRSESGHRRFGADQVETLVLVAERLRHGRSIGDVMADLHAGRLVPEGRANAPGACASRGAVLLDLLQVGDLASAEAEFARVVAGLSPIEQVRGVIEPSMCELGERWFRGECDIFQEHCATNFLRRKIHLLLDEAQRANPRPRRTAVVGTVQGDRHEGGVLMLSLLLELAGWRAQSVGVDVPTREYQKAVDFWKPDAVCLSFVMSRNINKRFDELAKIRCAPVFVGGRSILNYQGLARRHGLHPLIGPGEEAVGQMIAAVEAEDNGHRPAR